PPPTPDVTVTITAGPEQARQGDVFVFSGEARNPDGSEATDVSLSWSVSPATSGFIMADGRFVGYAPGTARVILSADGVSDTLEVQVQARAGPKGGFDIVGRGEVTTRFTSDLWVQRDVAYTATWGQHPSGRSGNALFAWDVSDPSAPVMTGSVTVDAVTVNDIKVRGDGTLAVITHEGSVDTLNGITLLDLTDPRAPTVIGRFTESLEAGVHNVWIDGDHVYACSDDANLRIIDISDPLAPVLVASFSAAPTPVHDVLVRDGLAFVSHWDAGLVILDVGNGAAGGSPDNPIVVGRVFTEGGQTHNAWYWPNGPYVFVGEEDFQTPGIMHVVNVSDLENPVEVATFRVPATTPHNFWMDEEREILYLAWYTEGVFALDVSGELLGELDRQDRLVASVRYDGPSPGVTSGIGTSTWAPQLYEGNVYISDLHSGLWVLRPVF
ncbi:MAG: hypothetical protein V3W35_08465, partial [Gemmatimonadota bacterium]